MRLSHLHLPNITPFAHASKIQQSLVSRLLAHKRLTSLPQDSPSKAPPSPKPPNPTILTFSPNPVYTTGRRDLPTSVSASDSATSQTTPTLPDPLKPISHLLTSENPLAEYHPTLRGGQTTYHGPGQLVAYTIFDLRTLNLSARTHIRLLEQSVIDVLATYGVKGRLEDEPGVWVVPKGGGESGMDDRWGEASRKICAVGVHLRRNVSSFGIGLNVTEEPRRFFELIVPCGLEGRGVTSLEGEGVRRADGGVVGVEEVAGRFVDAVLGRLREDAGEVIEGVDRVREEDVLDEVE